MVLVKAERLTYQNDVTAPNLCVLHNIAEKYMT